MNARKAMTAVALSALALAASGCVTSASTLNGTRIAIEEQLPGARFDSEFQLTLGRFSLGLARALIGDDAREEIGILKDVRRVEVAIYRTEYLPSVREAGFVVPHEKRLKKNGWQTITRAVSDDSATWVFLRQKEGRFQELMVGALDDDELVLVKLRGDIQSIIDRLLEEDVLDVPGVVRADLDPEPGEPIATVDDAE